MPEVFPPGSPVSNAEQAVLSGLVAALMRRHGEHYVREAFRAALNAHAISEYRRKRRELRVVGERYIRPVGVLLVELDCVCGWHGHNRFGQLPHGLMPWGFVWPKCPECGRDSEFAYGRNEVPTLPPTPEEAPDA